MVRRRQKSLALTVTRNLNVPVRSKSIKRLFRELDSTVVEFWIVQPIVDKLVYALDGPVCESR